MRIRLSQLQVSKSTVSFANNTWGEDLNISGSYMSLTQVLDAYLLPLLSFYSVIATFEIFH